jgi:diguanylate cyclase (GGDEF)-like protein/PAS domain S-box-containing protein
LSRFFESQLDYIFFFYGVGFLALGFVAIFSLPRTEARLPWRWLGLFGLAHGINEWLDMTALSLPDPPAFKVVRLAIMASSFVALFEFGRRGVSVNGKCRLGLWVYLPLLALGGMGGFAGMSGLNAACRYALGFPGALMAALALWREARESEERLLRDPLAHSAAVMGVYAVATGLIVSKASFFPASVLNQDTFFSFAGFPIQLVRWICALLLAWGVWRYGKAAQAGLSGILMEDARARGMALFPGILAMIVAAGWAFTHWTGMSADARMRSGILTQTRVAARAINVNRAHTLTGTPDDLRSPDYRRLKSQLASIRTAGASYRSVYLVGLRDSGRIFYVSSERPGSKDYSSPGQTRSEASRKLLDVFAHGRQTTEGRASHRHGAWVSAFVPINDPASGRVLAVLGTNVDASTWAVEVARERLEPIAITMLLLLVVLGVFAGYQRRLHFEVQLLVRARELEASEMRYRTLVDHLPHKVFIKDRNSVYVSCNEPYARDLRIPATEIAGKTDFDFYPPELAEKYRADDRRIMELGATEEIEEDYIEHGRPCIVRTFKTPVRDDQGDVTGVLGIFTDITERKLAEEKLLGLKAVVEQAADGIAVADLDGNIQFVNGAWARMHGYSVEELFGRHLSIFHTEEQLKNEVIPFNDQVMEHGSHEGEVGHVRRDGTTFPTWMSTALVLDASRKPIGLVGAARDITERKRAEEKMLQAKAELESLNAQLEEALLRANELAAQAETARAQTEEKAVELDYQSTHDPLTGLPNRQQFEARVREHTEATAGGKPRGFALVFLDLDRFKLVNDTMGHDAGDLLLVEVASRLRSCLRSGDILARMGGDEFTAILPRLQSRSSTEAVVRRILDSISQPFDVEDRRFVIGASIGIALYPSDGTDAVTLLKHADAAMYKAKQAGRGTFRWFTGDVDADNQTRTDIERDLRRALGTNQFRVYYQPIVNLSDGSLHSAEALLRWEHPEKGMISPSLFIPIAEEVGLISSIGDYVLRSACSQAKVWHDEGIPLSQVGVNVSAVQIQNAGWLDGVKAALSDCGLDPKRLILELTETDFAAEHENLESSLRKVQELGASVAIDDFGMGYSSLSRLKAFPGIHVKIDGSFIRDVEHNDSDRAILKSIIEMAHHLAIEVTAEWVETETQVEILRSAGCDLAQGYFFSPPLPADKFRTFAVERTSSAARKRRAA